MQRLGINIPALVVPNAKGGEWCLSRIRVLIGSTANPELVQACVAARDRRIASRNARQLVGNA